MARKPVDLTRAGGATSGRDAIWIAIRKLRTFTISDIEDDVMNVQKHNVRTSQDTIKTYLKGLERAGYIDKTAKRQRPGDKSGRYAQNQWTLVRDIGMETPRVTKEGKDVSQGLAREQMWLAMRILSDFNYVELSVHASTETVSVSHATARDYIKHLLKADYLIVKQKATPRLPARYRLIPSKFTGPMPPMVQRIKQVFDPNLNEVVWPKPEQAQEVASE